MKTVVRGLVLLGLVSCALSHCQRECSWCKARLGPAVTTFSTTACILECQGLVPAQASWATCARIPRSAPGRKRFGGFTGARKSARKLANQKRVSEFVRQFVMLSLQSSERHNRLPAALRARAHL
ncbi:prepronociceptin [Tachyglossus aculeatus]|uniref:prepronociceptin n=1 Tax=Tachyglossus aculeatus TaxID=9261 RepID=UPI0018F529D9|nr:prepronociceptin [Tachyglossus aculeatus]